MALHQLTEAKVNKQTNSKQTNNNNTSTSNKQTNQGSMCAGGGVELCSDRVQCAMHQSTWKGFGDTQKGFRDVLEIHQKSTEVDSTGCTLTLTLPFDPSPGHWPQSVDTLPQAGVECLLEVMDKSNVS